MSQLFQGLLWEPVFPPTPVLDDDFNAFNIPYFEDDFNRTDPSPWLPQDGGTIDIVAGTLRVTTGPANTGVGYYTRNDLITDKWYAITYDVIKDSDSEGRTRLSNSNYFNQEYGDFQAQETGTYTRWFQATNNILFITFSPENPITEGSTCRFDNVLIEEVPALDGWEPLNDGELSVVDGEMRVTIGVEAQGGRTSKEFTTTAATHYILSGFQNAADFGGFVWVGSAQGGNELTSILPSGTGDFKASFTASDADTFITVGPNTSSLGRYTSFDNITVQESLVENPTFDSDTAWVKGTGVTIAGGVAVCAAASGGTALRQDGILSANVTYIVEFEISNYSAGAVAVAVSGETGPTVSGNGKFVTSVTPVAPGNFTMFVVSTFTGDIDNFIATQDGGAVVGFGGVKFKENSVAVPPLHDRGLPFDDSFILAVDAVNPVDYVYQGLPFTVLGRIAVDLVGPVDRVAPGNIPLSAAGRLVFSAGPVAVAVAGVNYAADESVVGIPS